MDDDDLGVIEERPQQVYNCEHSYKKRGPEAFARRQTANQPQGGRLMVAKSNPIYYTLPESRSTIPISARAFGFDRRAARS